MYLRISAPILMVFLVATSCPAMPVLTGLINYSTNWTGGVSGGEFWNTGGGDIFYNLYVTAPNSSLGGTLLNSGNAAATNISFDLSTPGTYTFYILGEYGGTAPRYGLNLFFNDSSTPGITAIRSVNGRRTVSSTGANSVSLTGGITPGANTLAYSDDRYTVTLTDYGWYNSASAGLPAADRTSRYSSAASSITDYRGSFVLDVTTHAPEPGTWALLLMGLVGLGFAKNRF
jgi:hypothetical protein